MNIFRLNGVWLLVLSVLLGCAGAGKVGKLKNQSEADSKITWQNLVEDWSDYHIWYRSAAEECCLLYKSDTITLVT